MRMRETKHYLIASEREQYTTFHISPKLIGPLAEITDFILVVGISDEQPAVKAYNLGWRWLK